MGVEKFRVRIGAEFGGVRPAAELVLEKVRVRIGAELGGEGVSGDEEIRRACLGFCMYAWWTGSVVPV